MPEMNLADMGVIGLAVYGVIIISIKVIEVLRYKFTNSPPVHDAAQDRLVMLVENNNVVITELTHFLRTESEVDKEKDRHVEKQLDTIVSKVDRLSGLISQHCIDTKH